MHPRVKVTVDLLSKYGGKVNSIIELGVGDGSILSEVAKHVGARALYGCDIDDEALNKASEKGITTVKADLNTDKLPFPDNYFNAVIMEEVIEHLVNPDNALQEAYRILKPNGVFILSTPNLAWWVNRFILLLGYQPYWSEVSTKYNVGKLFRSINEPLSGHLRLYTLRALRELLKLHRFSVLTVKGAQYPHNNLFHLIDKAVSIISPGLAEILIIAAKPVK